MNARRGSLWPRLARLCRVALNIQCAVRAAGGWRGLGRQLKRARAHGWRDVYGTLIGLVATGALHRDRWYQHWLNRNESPVESGFGYQLAVIASPSDLERLADDCMGAVFLGPRTHLHDGALPALAAALADGAEVAYGDADQIDATGRRRRPFYKPDFSLDLFLYQDYLSDCIAVSRDFLDHAPPWNFDDAHGTLLRWLPFADQDRAPAADPLPRARNAPKPRGRRRHPSFGSCATATAAVPASNPLRPAETRRCAGGAGSAERRTRESRWSFQHATVSTCSSPALKVCTRRATRSASKYSSSTTLLPTPQLACGLARHNGATPPYAVLSDHGDFNWSRLNNLGIAAGTGDVFVFLNNDTLAIEAGWLDRLAEYALREDAGAVGPLLVFADGNVQHAGLVVGHGDHADPIYRGTTPEFDDHAFISPRLPRNVAAVTGACLATSRKTLLTIGTFDEDLGLAGDVEFCLRAHAAGLVNIYAGDIVLRHYESATIGRRSHGSDAGRLGRVVQATLPRDPFYNPNLACIAGVGRGAPAFALLHEDTSDAHLKAQRGNPLP